ncbi:type II toxin-antitoxin system RatA family toxin, partial [Bdellovibrionota bacterium]
KRFRYTLRLKENPPNTISWTFEEGDLFKSNEGGWELETVGDATRVSYHLEIDFKMVVPKMIAKKLAGANLPSMIKSFKERAENRAK